jgi:hypothetical protein
MNLLIVILFGLTGFFSAIIVTFYSLLLGVKRTNDILLSQNAILEKTAQESYIKLAALEQKLQVVQSEGSSSNFLVTALIVTSVIVVVVSVCIILSSNASVANSLTKAASEHTRSVANDIELLNTKMTKAISKASDSSLENAQIIVDDITKVSSKLDGKLDNVRDGIISGLEQSDAAVGSVLERVVHEQMETNIILNSVQMSHMRIMDKISNASEISTENDRVIVEGITNISSKLDSISTTTDIVTSALEDPNSVEMARTIVNAAFGA